jgi:DNA-binding NarL/FixJ family response regulator
MIVAMPGSLLLIDDDPVFRGLARRVLAASGLEVTAEAATAAEARAVACRQVPDAAVIDVGLPDASGLVLASELAALPIPPRVVLVSSDPDAAGLDDVRRCGAAAFVPKQELPDTAWAQLLAGR